MLFSKKFANRAILVYRHAPCTQSVGNAEKKKEKRENRKGERWQKAEKKITIITDSRVKNRSRRKSETSPLFSPIRISPIPSMNVLSCRVVSQERSRWIASWCISLARPRYRVQKEKKKPVKTKKKEKKNIEKPISLRVQNVSTHDREIGNDQFEKEKSSTANFPLNSTCANNRRREWTIHERCQEYNK